MYSSSRRYLLEDFSFPVISISQEFKEAIVNVNAIYK